jgi:hypothetical protein
VKAHYRAAYALNAEGKYSEAMSFAESGYNLEPKNKTMRILYQSIWKRVQGKNDVWKDTLGGAYQSTKFKKLIEQDEEDQTLKEKIMKKEAAYM